ncbi:hypothetical protein A5906_05925 [Bradyrhizobium sacchari]|nr:hypothetical protein A5906_05925 [Bradyrhizobium sacchari]
MCSLKSLTGRDVNDANIMLTIFTSAALPEEAPRMMAMWRARTHRIADHRRMIMFIFASALVVAGLFTRARTDHALGDLRGLRAGSARSVPAPSRAMPGRA